MTQTARVLWVIVGAAPIVAGVAAIQGGWTATSDWALIAARSLETLSWDPPLTGMPTSLSLNTDRALFHPGPLQFWIFSLPTRALGEPGYGLIVGAVAINVAAIAASFVMFRRARAPALLVGGAVLVALLQATLGARMLRDPFNPSVAVLPMLALLVATWSVLSGHIKAITIVVIFGSIAAQAHVMNLAMFALLLAVAYASLVITAGRRRPSVAREAARRWGAASVGLLVLCWSGPLVDQLAGDGNFMGLLTEGSAVGSGIRYATHRMVEMITELPWTRFPGGVQPDPDLAPIEIGIGAGMVLVVAATGIWAIRSGYRYLAAWQATALLACAGAVLTTARVPRSMFGTSSPASVLIWFPVGAIVHFASVWGLVAAVSAAIPRAAAGRRSDLRWALTAAAGAAVLVAAVGLGPLSPSGDPGSITWGAARTHADAIASELPPDRTVVLTVDGSPTATGFIPTLVGQLRLRGVEVLYTKDLPETGTFPQYHETGRERESDLMVVLIRAGDGSDRPLVEHRLISSYDPAQPSEPYVGYDQGFFGGGRDPTAVHVVEAE